MASIRRGEAGKQPRGVFVCGWQLPITFQQDERVGRRRRRRPFIPPLSLVLIYCLLVWLSLCDFLFSTPSPQTHLNNSSYQADPRLQTLPSSPSHVLLLIVWHILGFLLLLLSLLLFHRHQFMFFYLRLRKMNSMQGVVQIYSVNMLTRVSLFTVGPLC